MNCVLIIEFTDEAMEDFNQTFNNLAAYLEAIGHPLKELPEEGREKILRKKAMGIRIDERMGKQMIHLIEGICCEVKRAYLNFEEEEEDEEKISREALEDFKALIEEMKQETGKGSVRFWLFDQNMTSRFRTNRDKYPNLTKIDFTNIMYKLAIKAADTTFPDLVFDEAIRSIEEELNE